MSAEEFLNSDVKKLGKSLLWEFFDLASNTENVISLVLVNQILKRLGILAKQVYMQLKKVEHTIHQHVV